METVLGLSVTRTRVGWVLVEGQDADGAALESDEFSVGQSGGIRAVATAERAAAAVLRTRDLAHTHGQRLHAVGVTWSDDAAVGAALLLEFLTDAGVDNVVPIRFLHAAEALACAIGPVIGSETTAVCHLQDQSATVVVVGGNSGGTQIAVKQAVDDDGLIRWLTTLFDREHWRPDGLVVAGPATGSALDAITARLENALGIPAIAHAGTPLALARGAALASAPSAEFTGTRLIEAPADLVASSGESRRLAYAGAVTMLVAGAVAFVVSLSLAVGLRLVPDNGPGERITDTSATPPIAEAAVPARPPRVAPVRTAAKESRTPPDQLPGGDRPDQTPPVPSP